MMQAGFPKLFVLARRANIAHLIGELGTPFPEVIRWVVGVIEFSGGLGILLGASIAIAAGLNVIDIIALLVLSLARGGIPEPLPGGDPFPDYRLAVLILAGMLTLVLGGAGAYSIEGMLSHKTESNPILNVKRSHLAG